MADGSMPPSGGHQGDINGSDVRGERGTPPEVPKSDPRLNLTPMQTFKLKKNWKGIKRRLEDTGVEMLIRLFRIAPSTQAQFKNFQNLETEDKLRMSEELEKHAGKMMSVLDDIVNNIDNVDYAIMKIGKTAQHHNQFEGFSAEQFRLMEQPFLDAVRIILGDRYTDNMDTIYRILIKFILDNLVKSAS